MSPDEISSQFHSQFGTSTKQGVKSTTPQPVSGLNNLTNRQLSTLGLARQVGAQAPNAGGGQTPQAAPAAPKPKLNFYQRNVPTITGILGGIGGAILGGPPGAVAGAAAGGAAGESAKLAYEGKANISSNKSTLSNVLQNLANNKKQELIQGAEQGGAALAGETVLKPLMGLVGGKLAGISSGLARTASSALEDTLSKGANAPIGISDLTHVAQRSINKSLPEDMGLFTKLGVKTAGQLKDAVDMITGSNGWLSSVTRRVVESGGPVNVAGAVDAADNAAKNIADSSVSRMVSSRLGEVVDKLGIPTQAAAGHSAGMTANEAVKVPAGNVLDAIQHAEGIMSGLRSSLPDQAALKDALHGVVNSLQGILHNSAGADSVMNSLKLGPEETKAIVDEATQKGIPKVGQYIADTVNNATKLAENRSAQAPFVRASQALQGAENSAHLLNPPLANELASARTPFRAVYSMISKPIVGAIRGVAGNPLTQAAGAALGGAGRLVEAATPLAPELAQIASKGGNVAEAGLQKVAGALSGLPPKTYIGGPLSGLVSGAAQAIPRETPTPPTQTTDFTQPSQQIGNFLNAATGSKLSTGAEGVLNNYRDSLAGLNSLQAAMGSGGSYGKINGAITGTAPAVAKALGLSTSKANLTTVLHYLPSITDSPQAAQQKLQSLKQLIDTHAEQNLADEVSKMQKYGALDQYLVGASQ